MIAFAYCSTCYLLYGCVVSCPRCLYLCVLVAPCGIAAQPGRMNEPSRTLIGMYHPSPPPPPLSSLSDILSPDGMGDDDIASVVSSRQDFSARSTKKSTAGKSLRQFWQLQVTASEQCLDRSPTELVQHFRWQGEFTAAQERSLTLSLYGLAISLAYPSVEERGYFTHLQDFYLLSRRLEEGGSAPCGYCTVTEKFLWNFDTPRWPSFT